MVLVWVINIFTLSIPSKIYIKPVPEVYNGRKKLTKTQHNTDQTFIWTRVIGSSSQNTTNTTIKEITVIKITQGFKLKLLIHELLKLLKTEPSQFACDAGLRGGGSWERRGRAISGLQDTADTQTWKPQKDPFTAACTPEICPEGLFILSHLCSAILDSRGSFFPTEMTQVTQKPKAEKTEVPPPTVTGSHFWISCHEMHQLLRQEVLEGLQPWKSQPRLKMSRLLRPPGTKLSLVLDGIVGIPKKTHQQTTQISSDSHGFALWILRDSAIRTGGRAPKSLRPPQGTPPRSPPP